MQGTRAVKVVIFRGLSEVGKRDFRSLVPTCSMSLQPQDSLFHLSYPDLLDRHSTDAVVGMMLLMTHVKPLCGWWWWYHGC